MKKDDFLGKLGNSLGNIPEEEKKDILYDYEEHFRIGSENGKSEEEIAELLGDPVGIAKQYDLGKKENLSSKKINRRTVSIISIITAVAFIAVFILCSNWNKLLGNNTDSLQKNIVSSNTPVVNSSGDSNKSASANQSTGSSKESSTNVDEDKKLKLDGIKQLNIYSPCYPVKIIVQSRNDAEAKFYGNINISSGNSGQNGAKPELQVESQGDTGDIKIVSSDNQSNTIYNSDIKLDIYLPENYSHNLTINTESASINADKLCVDELNAESKSGSIELSNIKANGVVLKNSSGVLKLSNAVIKNQLNEENTSGNITGDSVTADSAKLKITSGNIDFKNFSGDINSYNTSGDTQIEYSKFNNVVQVNSVSGNIKINFPVSAAFSIHAVTKSGSISNQINEIKESKADEKELDGILNNGDKSVTITTISGNIELYKKN